MRRVARGHLVALTLFGGLIMLLATSEALAFGGARRTEYDRADILQYLQDRPGAPLVLPRELPRDYRWLGPTYSSPGTSGLIESRSSTFVDDPIAGSPSVELCVRGRGVDLCPQGMHAIRRSSEFGEVVVAFDLQAPSDAELEWWRSVELVSDLSVAWLE